MAWDSLFVFLIVSALCCCIGFRKYVYFISIGYGFAVAGLGLAYAAAAFISGKDWNIIALAQWFLFVLYGLRLSIFLLLREMKNKSYRKTLSEADGYKPRPFSFKMVIWVSVSILYVTQTCPVFYRVQNGFGAQVAVPLAGLIISAAGLTLETLADRQKSAQKAANPDTVATKGLFRIVRCPNYFGEILYWTGVFISGCAALRGGQWTLAVIGYVMIVFIMFNSAQRLDRRQEKRYGKIPEYRAYADHTPIIIPFLPVYHIGKK